VARALVFLSAFLVLSVASGADWPQWGYDAERSRVSPAQMPAGLKLQWTRQLAKPEKAWPEPQYMLHFDRSYEPIARGKLLFVGSMVRDRVTAYDTETGEERWRFYAGGPIRFAPVAYEHMLYVASDDGFLYCLDAKTGELIRELRGGPDNRRGLGNGRLCSLWPARGAPVLHGDTVYFAASIWPFMGTFIYALDARTGKVVWCNSGNGSRWTDQPHGGAAAFSGVAPQGYLAATDKFLVVPNGRTLPGVFDRATGRFLYSHMGTKWGGAEVRVARGTMNVMGLRFDVATGRGMGGATGFPADKGRIFLIDPGQGSIIGQEPYTVDEPDRSGKPRPVEKVRKVWEGKVTPALAEIHIKAGDRLYGRGSDGSVLGVALLPGGGVKLDFRAEIEGRLWRLLAADNKLFAVNEAGRIYCFGTKGGEPKTHALATAPLAAPPADKWTERAAALLKQSDATGGWCVSLGIGSGRLIDAVLRRSKLHVIAIDRDAAKVDALRRRMDDAGLYGSRVTALVGDPFDYDLPPYIADLIFSENLIAAGFDARTHKPGRIVGPLRPYGGTAVLPARGAARALLVWARNGRLDGATGRRAADDIIIRRAGALPRSADWSHQYADAANSVVSPDDRVRLPLGLLWFGGNTHLDILPRHGHGPTPQVVAGRLIIEGIDMLSARDAYTGRVIWKRTFKGFSNFGMYWDHSFRPDVRDRSYNQVHIAGANALGANYVSAPDHVYLINGPDLLVLDAATGETAKTFRLPRRENDRPNWGVAMRVGDLLIAGTEPVDIRPPPKPAVAPAAGEFRLEGAPGVTLNRKFATGSRSLVVLERRTGRVLWSRRARMSFRHNAIVASGDKVFVIDGFSAPQRSWLKTAGRAAPDGAVFALELRTGKVVWEARQNVTGTWLGYSKEHDILLQGGSASRDRAGDETRNGLIAYRGRDGGIVWSDLERAHTGPMILHGDTFITNGGWGGEVFELKTGKPKTLAHALTLKPVPMRWGRLYGCNTAIAGKHLMTFRSGAAGHFDLDSAGGTGNFGGFKSGCTSSLVPACGVLNAPDYTRTCTCAYQNQTSLALVHMPSVETWTFSDLPHPGKDPIRRVGLNLGAPGDRKHGATLWLDMPPVGARGPQVTCGLGPVAEKRFAGRFFRSHSSAVEAGPLRWVAASGAEGVTVLTVDLIPAGGAPAGYTVRLVFAEPKAGAEAGGRVFDVLLQGEVVEAKFDVVAAAGGARRSVVRAYKSVRVTGKLVVELKPVKGEPILCGVEAIAQ